jgi:hypothetical protein
MCILFEPRGRSQSGPPLHGPQILKQLDELRLPSERQ